MNATGPAKNQRPGYPVSHFNPRTFIFRDRDFWGIVAGNVGVVSMLACLAWLTYTTSYALVLKCVPRPRHHPRCEGPPPLTLAAARQVLRLAVAVVQCAPRDHHVDAAHGRLRAGARALPTLQPPALHG